jgi:hypothetical protein
MRRGPAPRLDVVGTGATGLDSIASSINAALLKSSSNMHEESLRFHAAAT